MIDKTKLNVPLVRGIQDHIRQEPLRLDMEKWKECNLTGRLAPPCQTAACFAGWACLLRGYTQLVGWEIPLRAAVLLGLATDEEIANVPENASGVLDWLKEKADISAIFFTDDWPEPFGSDCQAALEDENTYTVEAHQQVATIAIARLEHLIQTGQ